MARNTARSTRSLGAQSKPLEMSHPKTFSPFALSSTTAAPLPHTKSSIFVFSRIMGCPIAEAMRTILLIYDIPQSYPIGHPILLLSQNLREIGVIIQFSGNKDTKPEFQPKNQPKSGMVIAFAVSM